MTNCYTLVFVRPDGARPMMDVIEANFDSAALDHADTLLADHESCSHVEVWHSDEHIGTTHRAS